MLEAMIAGQHDPAALAAMAYGRMRSKLSLLEEALTGHFTAHHGFICRMMLDRVDDITRRIASLTARIEEHISPYAETAGRLDEIPGISATGAQELIAEIGLDMSRFPDAAHLVSRAKFAPIDRNSAGKKKGGSTGKGNPWLAGTVGEIVIAAARTDTFLAERYRRIARRRGRRRAIVAVGNSVLTILWHMLSDPVTAYHDLGPGFYESRISKDRRQRNLIRQLEQLTGQTVALQPAA
jgi:transposase